MSQARITVIRHGETEWNAEGRWMGQLDSPLTANGIAQARHLADRLAHLQFDAFYSSDLGRAAATSAIIAEKQSLKATFDVRLRERHLGVLQGLTIAEMRTRHTQVRADYEKLGHDYVIPGGESARQRLERTVACLEELAARHGNSSILVVTHGGILSGLFQHVVGIPPDTARRFSLLNAALNVFLCENGGWKLETWGDIAHLNELKTLDDPGKA